MSDMGQITVPIIALGKCEHCGCLVNTTNLDAEAIDATWKCPQCEKELTHKSFGYDQGGKGAKKIKWIGPDGEWQDTEPTEPFDLGNWFVVTQPSLASIFRYSY